MPRRRESNVGRGGLMDGNVSAPRREAMCHRLPVSCLQLPRFAFLAVISNRTQLLPVGRRPMRNAPEWAQHLSDPKVAPVLSLSRESRRPVILDFELLLDSFQKQHLENNLERVVVSNCIDAKMTKDNRSRSRVLVVREPRNVVFSPFV